MATCNIQVQLEATTRGAVSIRWTSRSQTRKTFLHFAINDKQVRPHTYRYIQIQVYTLAHTFVASRGVSWQTGNAWQIDKNQNMCVNDNLQMSDEIVISLWRDQARTLKVRLHGLLCTHIHMYNMCELENLHIQTYILYITHVYMCSNALVAY